jgi:MYXO-CTERM domain-containing protein
MNDIFARLNSIRDLHPEVFTSLSFGRVTSGTYQVPIIRTNAGHVGVVVYPTGTDYRQTGVIIHGTPTWSPTDLDEETMMATQPMGAHKTINVFREGTADHGMYYRTPLKNFPGTPKPENPLGCGFEGAYADNSSQFARTPPSMCAVKSNQEADIASNAQSCPFYPNAVVVRTESPVDLLITNSRGQRVQTTGGLVTQQELDGGIFSFPERHLDGTYAWVVVLPKDKYDIALTGTGSGPYKLTMRKFDASGARVDKVVEGVAAPARVENFTLDGGTPEVVLPPGGSGGNAGEQGGGGSTDFTLLLALAGLLLVAARRRRTRVSHRVE